MSATRLTQPGEGVEILKEYLDGISDPKLIISAHDTYREQIALTEEEEAKVKEARELIDTHSKILADLKIENEKSESIKADLAKQEDVLANDRANISKSLLEEKQKIKQEKDAAFALIAEHTADLQKQKDAFESEKKSHLQEIQARHDELNKIDMDLATKLHKFENEDKPAFELEKQNVEALKNEALALKEKYEKKLALIHSDVE